MILSLSFCFRFQIALHSKHMQFSCLTVCCTLLKLAQGKVRAAGENPEGWIDGLSKLKIKRMEGIRPVRHIIERSLAFLAV